MAYIDYIPEGQDAGVSEKKVFSDFVPEPKPVFYDDKKVEEEVKEKDEDTKLVKKAKR